MISYFAQLMRSTGLAPGSGARTAGRGGARDIVAPTAPLHLEQTTMVEAPQADAGERADASESMGLPPALVHPASGDAHHHSSMPRAGEAPINRINETTGSQHPLPPGPVPPTLAAPLSPHSPSQPAIGSNRERGESGQVASQESNLAPAVESHFLIEEHSEDRSSRAEWTLELPQTDEPSDDENSLPRGTHDSVRESDYTEAVAHLEAEAIEQADRANPYQSVLMAVKEWITATPIIDQEDATDESIPEGHWESKSLFADLEDAAFRTAHGESESSRGPDVQDISLSVGTISIVIEEPPRNFYAQPVAPRAESRPETPSPSSSLSRYYLRIR